MYYLRVKVSGVFSFKSQKIYVCLHGVCHLAKLCALGAYSYLNSWWTAPQARTHTHTHAREYNVSYFLLLYRTRRQNKESVLPFPKSLKLQLPILELPTSVSTAYVYNMHYTISVFLLGMWPSSREVH